MPRGSVRQKPSHGDDAWEVQASAGTDPLTGKRLRLTRLVRGARGDAERALTKLLAEVDEKPQATEGTVAHLLEEWYRHRGRQEDWSPKTAQDYRSTIDKRLRPDLGAIKLRDLTTERIDRYQVELMATGLAPTTVRNYCTPLRQALRLAVEWKWLPVSPAAGLKGPKIRKRQPTAPSAGDLKRLVEHIEKANPELALAIRLDANIGARRGEVVALRWRDINWTRSTLRVHRNIIQLDDGTLIEKSPKTHQERTVTLSPSIMERLRAHRVTMEARAELGATTIAADGFLFSNALDCSGSWRPHSVTQAFSRVRDALDMKGVRLHDVRHFMATQWLADGVDPATVSARLGHGQVSTTLNIYAHVVVGKDAEAAARLDGLLD